MQLEFGYGNGVQTVELPQENLLGVLHAAPILVGRECYETVRCVDSDAAGCIHLGDTSPARSRKPTSGSAWATSSFIILPDIPAARRRTPICTRRKRRWTTQSTPSRTAAPSS